MGERAAGALANLFNDHSENVRLAFKQAPNLVPALLSVIQNSAMVRDARRQAVHALAMLAAEDSLCTVLWRAGVGPPMLALLREGIAEAALRVMNLAWRWPEVKQELANRGSLEMLMEILANGDAMAKEYAAGALMNMTAGTEEHAERVQGCIPDLVALLRAESLQAAEWGAGALANIARAGAEARKSAADHGAVEFLAELLQKASENGKTLVVLALTSLAESEPQAVASGLNGPQEKAKLRELRDRGNGAQAESLTVLVSLIGGDLVL
eukprot:NODE_2403_length_942_cov_257.764374.p2 GENE.NODE_2403_length_942_cov_257.764374~~NODE_2403_length_942_cov_257.764374.p2  ORF type:complete len:269 (-),score=114.77 NODE_2403_length_942_cov_257.764374:118-924(-)